jgi:hypothetical protein
VQPRDNAAKTILLERDNIKCDLEVCYVTNQHRGVKDDSPTHYCEPAARHERALHPQIKIDVGSSSVLALKSSLL